MYISNMFNYKIDKPEDNPNVLSQCIRCYFTKTPLLSTYLFALAAGNWMKISGDNTQNYNNIPQSIYCRKYYYNPASKLYKEINTLINKGLAYYEKYFNMPFVYQKYDQIFCPEMKYSAMENPGLVGYTEGYLHWTEDQVSSLKKTNRAITILHELSHMWFGNLVTMKWWDDLWLNEAFATYISYQALNDNEWPLEFNFGNAWTKFLFYKRSGVSADSLETTFPISNEVKDTDANSMIYSDIVYSKGASSLKQLRYRLRNKKGEDVLEQALQLYIKTYQNKNADIGDFFTCV